MKKNSMERYNDKVSPELIGKRFPLLDKTLLEEISKVGEWVSIEEGEALLTEKNYIRSFPLILDGLARVSRIEDSGRENLLYYLSAGEVCSMALTCCMAHTKSNVSVVGEAETDLLLIPVAYLDEWMSKYQSWKVFVMHSYRKRFDDLLDTVDSLAFKKMDERLITFFKTYYRSSKKSEYYGKHEDIAQALTTSREVISRLLKTLEREGKIELGRNYINFTKVIR